jgi:hypothetical protein
VLLVPGQDRQREDACRDRTVVHGKPGHRQGDSSVALLG